MPIIEFNNTVVLIRTTKVALPPKFKGDPSRLKEYIARSISRTTIIALT